MLTFYAIAGAKFRPYGQEVLDQLPDGARLTLVYEPENPYDRAAVAVYVDLSEHHAISAELGKRLVMDGRDPSDIVQNLPESGAAAIKIGFVKKEQVRELRQANHKFEGFLRQKPGAWPCFTLVPREKADG